MAELPILPLKTDALLADTSHMTAEEFGAYCRLLFTMWRHGASLPDNDEELRRVAGFSKYMWQQKKEKILRPMTKGGGVIFQKRLSSTWLDVQELRNKRALAATKRWSKRNASAHAYASPAKMQVDMPGIPVCNANQIRKKETTSLPSAAREAGCVENPATDTAAAAPKRPPTKEGKLDHGLEAGTQVGPDVWMRTVGKL